MIGNERNGHLAALGTILIWGTTFISTKFLLEGFAPIEILFFRFLIGFVLLCVLSRTRIHTDSFRQELTYILAGCCGVCLYYLLENIALTYTLASNVGVILSIAPFFTAMITHFFTKEKHAFHPAFFLGFLLAMAGICMISFQNSLEVRPFGDLLAVLAALVWACYSVLTRKISSFDHPTIASTKRIFFYGLVCMLPILYGFDFHWDLTRFTNPVYLGNILFLGIGASALCFVSWNYALKVLGAVKTSVYIYLVPVITIVTSMLFLNESITLMSGIGTLLTLAGLYISEKRI